MSELNKPPLEKTNIELENSAHWEDGGGRILNVVNPIAPSFTNVAGESVKRMLNASGITTAG